jgi:phage FluMu gp28-like protein
LLLPYQRRWADDEARWKIGLMARQVGKDFSSGEEGVRDCFRFDLKKEKTNWMIAAPSERQSLESLEKWKEWVEAYKLAIDDYQEEREGGSETLLKSATIQLPHGSRIIAVPGKPDTVRGYSANLLLTEFAFFEDPDRTWRAILPSVTNPLRGGQKKVRLISTPNGAGNKFHDLWSKNFGRPEAKWSCHKVSIHDAVAQGLPIDVEELREAIGDPEGWAQEFECEFIDAAGVLLPYEVIALCESVEATETVAPEFWGTAHGPFPVVLGIDFARKKDMTVCWADELVADLAIAKEVLTLHNMSTPDQVEHLRPRVRRAVRACLDYTGPGVGLGDYLVKEFGEYDPARHLFGKIELCTASNAFNQDIFSKLRMAFDNRRARIPISRVIREDLHSVYRIATKTGQISYRAPHTETGHADRCYAKALATRAGSVEVGAGRLWLPPGGSKRGRVLAWRRERSVAG